MTISPRARLLELERGQPLATLLRDAWAKAPSYRKCAAELGVPASTMQGWMQALGLRPSKNPLRPRLVKERQGKS